MPTSASPFMTSNSTRSICRPHLTICSGIVFYPFYKDSHLKLIILLPVIPLQTYRSYLNRRIGISSTYDRYSHLNGSFHRKTFPHSCHSALVTALPAHIQLFCRSCLAMDRSRLLPNISAKSFSRIQTISYRAFIRSIASFWSSVRVP